MNNFTRGGNPKETMGIGRDAILKEIGGIIIDKENPNSKFSSETAVVILVSKGKYKLLRNRFGPEGEEGDEKDLIYLLLKLQEQFRKYDPNSLFFPSSKKVVARTLGSDIVTVRPISAPSGILYYIDYKIQSKEATKPHEKLNI